MTEMDERWRCIAHHESHDKIISHPDTRTIALAQLIVHQYREFRSQFAKYSRPAPKPASQPARSARSARVRAIQFEKKMAAFSFELLPPKHKTARDAYHSSLLLVSSLSVHGDVLRQALDCVDLHEDVR